MHEATAGAAIGGVVDQGHAGPLQDRHSVSPTEGLELLMAGALVWGQIGRMFFAPGAAVGVFQHHLHRQPLAVLSRQRFGQLRQRQLLHRYQDFPPRRLNTGQHESLEIIALTPLTVDRAAVAAGFGVVEGQLDALGDGLGPG